MNRRLLPTALLAILAGGLLGCPPLEPCSDCPSVGGTYLFRAQPIDSISGGGTGLENPCAAIAFPGANDTLTLYQSSSNLTADGWMSFDRGTLFEDDSLVLGPQHYLQTASGEVLITLTGIFVEARDGWVVQGQAIFDLSLQACNLSTPMDLIQQPTTP